jgi:hypothetical protein
MWTELVLLRIGTSLRALVNAVMNLRFPQDAVKLFRCNITGGLSSSAQLHIVSYCHFIYLRFRHSRQYPSVEPSMCVSPLLSDITN